MKNLGIEEKELILKINKNIGMLGDLVINKNSLYKLNLEDSKDYLYNVEKGLRVLHYITEFIKAGIDEKIENSQIDLIDKIIEMGI